MKHKVLLALVSAGVTAAYVVPIAGVATSTDAGKANPYGGVRVVRP